MKDNPHTEKTIKAWYYPKSKEKKNVKYQPKRNYDASRFDAKKADELIKYCKECKMCWQVDWEASRSTYNRERNRTLYNHYDNFPTYGKEREICPMCKNKGE